MNTWGLVSQLLFAACLIPQPLKTYKTKSVNDVSILMWVLQFGGYSLGLVYGTAIKEMPLILGNIFGLICSVIFFSLYCKYRGK